MCVDADAQKYWNKNRLHSKNDKLVYFHLQSKMQNCEEQRKWLQQQQQHEYSQNNRGNNVNKSNHKMTKRIAITRNESHTLQSILAL